MASSPIVHKDPDTTPNSLSVSKLSEEDFVPRMESSLPSQQKPNKKHTTSGHVSDDEELPSPSDVVQNRARMTSDDKSDELQRVTDLISCRSRITLVEGDNKENLKKGDHLAQQQSPQPQSSEEQAEKMVATQGFDFGGRGWKFRAEKHKSGDEIGIDQARNEILDSAPGTSRISSCALEKRPGSRSPSPDVLEIFDLSPSSGDPRSTETLPTNHETKSRMTDLAYLYLPHLGTLCGVYVKNPVMMVYAVYYDSQAIPPTNIDFSKTEEVTKVLRQLLYPNKSTLNYILGNGSFVKNSEVLFNVWFCHEILRETQNQENLMENYRLKKEYVIDKGLKPYASKADVERILTFDSREYPSEVELEHGLTSLAPLDYVHAAFSPLPRPRLDPQRQMGAYDNTPPYDFNPRIPRVVLRNNFIQEERMLDTYGKFRSRYQARLSFPTFRQAAFCLAGLLRHNLIPFNYDNKGNRRGTEGGWTADDFIIRWPTFEVFVDKFCLIQCPDPGTWMTARLNEEETTDMKLNPWKGQVNGIQQKSIVDWDFTLGIKWRQVEVKKYPRNCCFKSVQSRISCVLRLDKFEVKLKPKPEVVDLEKWCSAKDIVDLGDLTGTPNASISVRDFPLDWIPVASGSGTKRKRDDDRQSGSRKILHITPTKTGDAQSKHLLAPSSSTPLYKPKRWKPLKGNARAPPMLTSISKTAKPYPGKNPLRTPNQSSGFRASKPHQDPITPTPKPKASPIKLGQRKNSLPAPKSTLTKFNGFSNGQKSKDFRKDEQQNLAFKLLGSHINQNIGKRRYKSGEPISDSEDSTDNEEDDEDSGGDDEGENEILSEKRIWKMIKRNTRLPVGFSQAKLVKGEKPATHPSKDASNLPKSSIVSEDINDEDGEDESVDEKVESVDEEVEESFLFFPKTKKMKKLKARFGRL